MPNSPSAEKRLRQTAKRSLRNKTLRTAMRTHEKKVLQLIEEGNRADAEALLPALYQHLDKAAKQRILHPNTAANHKSRLTRKVRAI